MERRDSDATPWSPSHTLYVVVIKIVTFILIVCVYLHVAPHLRLILLSLNIALYLILLLLPSNCTSIHSPIGLESSSCSDVVLDVYIPSMPTSCPPSVSSSPTLDVTESVRRSTRLCKAPSRLTEEI